MLKPFVWNNEVTKMTANDWNRPMWCPKGTSKHDHQMAKIVVRIPDDEMIRFGHEASSRIGESGTVREYGCRLAGYVRLPLYEFPDLDIVTPWFLGAEVLYEKATPASWIVKNYDRTNTEERTKRYTRNRQAEDSTSEEVQAGQTSPRRVKRRSYAENMRMGQDF